MAIVKGWSFGKEHGYTGSAKPQNFAKGGAVKREPDRESQRSERAIHKIDHKEIHGDFASGGKVQKHYDRMENYRKENDAEKPLTGSAPEPKLAKGGRLCKAKGGSVKKNLAPSKKLGKPGGDGAKNVVGFKKGGKTSGKGSKGGTAAKAAGALAQIAAMAQGQGGGAGGPPPSMGMPPAGMPPGAGGPLGMKRGGKSKKK